PGLERLRISQPAAVGRPVDARRGASGQSVDFDWLDFLYVHVPDAPPLVRVGDLPAVGRPRWVVEERWRIAKVDLLHFAHSLLIAQVQRVLSRFVGEVSDPSAVGRPGRIALGHAWGVSQVARVAFFSRDADDFAAGFEDRAGASRRNRGVVDTVRDLLVFW